MIKEETIPNKKIKTTSKPIIENRTTTPNKKNINYKYVGQESIINNIRKIIPPQFIATKKTGTIFGILIIVGIIISLLQFPLSSLMSGQTEITIKIGYPLAFMELSVKEAEKSPIRITNLIIDLLIYLILAYGIDIIINLIIKNPLLQSEEEKKKTPTILKNPKPTITENITKKVIKNITKNKELE